MLQRITLVRGGSIHDVTSRSTSSEPSVRGETSASARTLRRDVEAVAIPRIELLVERDGGEPGIRLVVLDGDLFKLGSHPANNVVLNDRSVSRFHCQLSTAGGAWRIVDSGSLNGTRIDGVRVRDADLPLPECRIELGDSIVRVRALGSASDAEVPAWVSFGALYGSSLAMRRLYALLDKLAQSDANVLVEGESGTGKELVAAELAQRGGRADRPFVIVDCGAISPNLIESELFGHVRGAFTGASRDRIGAFEAADGGTLFLDEVGELPLDMQPKLLRALEAREVRRIGENRVRKIDVRVVAATNRRLEREVNHGRFREDLYFRLSVVTVRVPPLRERLEDLRTLIDVLLDALKATEKASLFTPQVLADMARYDWPGNVRELRNYVARVVVLDKAPPAASRANTVYGMPLNAEIPGAPTIELSFAAGKEQVITAYERRYLGDLLRWAGGNVSRAARKAGMDRMHLYRLLQKHELHGASGKGLGADAERKPG
jgi:DNA-binding NtrC family response regulator